MRVLEVTRPGAQTLVMDAGFRGGRGQGVPGGGVMDRRALALVNALLGNPVGAAALEVTLVPPVLRAVGGAVRVALSGALSGKVAGRTVGPWQSALLAEGEELCLDPPLTGARGLIGIAGGIAVPQIMNSRSTCLRAGFGGFAGRALIAGDRLPVGPATATYDMTLVPPPDARGPLRVVAGPQAEWFAAEATALFTATEWRVTDQADRMGMRLEGPALPFASGRGADITSDGIAPGAIQVPGTGRPIVLLADAQTTGGYAKIATVIRADLWRLAAAVPGDSLRFVMVTVEEAEAAARVEHALIAAAMASVVPLRRVPDTATLMAADVAGQGVDARHPDHFPGALEG